MDYLTVEQMAKLKDCSTQYVQKLCKIGKLETKQEPNSKGRMKYLISVSSLSEDLQIKYYSTLKKECGITLQLQEANKKKNLKERSKGVRKPFEEFSEIERNQIVFWSNLLDEWQTLRAPQSSKTEFDKLFVAKTKFENPDLELSVGILYRKYTAYKENDLNGLIDNRGGHNKGKSSIPPQVWEAFLWYYLDQKRLTVSKSYTLTLSWCNEFYPELLEEIPVERTFRRHVESDILQAVKIYKRDGEKAMKDRCLPYIQRMYDNLNANDVWIADNHTLDVISIDEETQIKHRLCITTFQDAKSGVITGWNITDNPSMQSTVLALRHGIKRFGIPKIVYVDNGREFLNFGFGGQGNREHKSSKENSEILPTTILQRLQIEMRNAIVRNAKAKPIERTFYTLKNQLSKVFNGYCGGTILERPESLKRRIKRGDIETEDELREMFQQYIDYDYNLQNYGGSESKFKGISRLEVWESSIQNREVETFDVSTLEFMLMRTNGYQKIKKNGIFINFHGEKLWYYDEFETWKHFGEEVYARYNPADPTKVYIYDINDRYLWTWKCSDSMVLSIMNEAKENIREAMRLEKSVEKQIIQYLKELKSGKLNASFNGEGIKRIDMLLYNQKPHKYMLQSVKHGVKAVHQSTEPIEKVAGDEQNCVVFDITRVRKNIENTKKKG